jgi:NAD-dependent deacetylase
MSVAIPQELVERLAAAHRVAVLTGAGISAESGIPTFRDALTGLWANYDTQDLASPEGFARNPKLVWEWYAARRASIAGVQPNPGHVALAALEKRFEQFTLVTQNIDSLHQRAGSRDVVELHGNIARVKCSLEQIIVSDFSGDESPPRCWRFSAARRGVVGEMLAEAGGGGGRAVRGFLSIGTGGLSSRRTAALGQRHRSGNQSGKAALSRRPRLESAGICRSSRNCAALPAALSEDEAAG